MPAAAAPGSLTSAVPREILYQILTLCNETYDVVKDSRDCAGRPCFSVGRGCGSKTLSRVCHLWRSCIEAGMVPSTPLASIQLTDEQFLQLTGDSPPGVTSECGLSLLRGYRTITILYQALQRAAPLQPSSRGPRIPAPAALNLVVLDARNPDIRDVLARFQTAHRSLQDDHHAAFLASREPAPPPRHHLTITVWNGTLPSALGIPPGFSRVDLAINHWTDPSSIGDIPWVFGQLCRGARPHTLGFHLLSAHGSQLTDQWHVQRACEAEPANTLLRTLHVSGIGSDGFLRLLQCAAVQVWSVRVLEIAVPVRLARGCFWDWRMFERETWPVDAGRVSGWEGVAFPRVALGRLVDGRVEAVEKESMESVCQIAHFAPGWMQNDIESYAGRSLRWASLEMVVAEGEGVWKRGFRRLVTEVGFGRCSGSRGLR